MLAKAEKQQIINSYKSSFSDEASFLLINFKGAKVSEFELLRKKLRSNNTKLSVVKNNLLKKASQDTNIADLFTDTRGETAIAFLNDNYVEVTKAFVEVQEEHPNLAISLGFIEGKAVYEDELKQISKLPSREALIGQFLSVINQPLVKFINVSQAIPRKLINALNNLKDKK